MIWLFRILSLLLMVAGAVVFRYSESGVAVLLWILGLIMGVATMRR